MHDSHELQMAPSGEREIIMTRTFEASREQVFAAFTQPQLVKQWLCARGWELPVCRIDLQPGGETRYVWRNDSGAEMGLSGVFREISPPARLVHTEIFDEDWTGGRTLVTTAFDQTGEQTQVTMTIRYSSSDVRDAILQSSMEQGIAENFDKLAVLLVQAA